MNAAGDPDPIRTLEADAAWYIRRFGVLGKTFTAALPNPAAVRKAEQEIAAFRNYQQLSRDLVDVSEQVCRLRPVEETLTAQQKTAEAIRQEVTLEIDRLVRIIFNGRRRSGCLDLEASRWRCARPSSCRSRSAQLAVAVPGADSGPADRSCPCGHEASYQDIRSKPVLTAVGPAEVSRPYYLCRALPYRPVPG